MSPTALRISRLSFFLGMAAVQAGCGMFSGTSTGSSIASIVTPYRVEVVQGNFVSREQVEALRPGMGRQQVRDILGTPLLTSLFHGDRWDYVFTLKRPGVEPQTRRLTVFFKGAVLERHEGDEMPTETEFVASLEGRRGKGKVPVLEATEAQLARFPVKAVSEADKAAEVAPSAAAASARDYPPLEPALR